MIDGHPFTYRHHAPTITFLHDLTRCEHWQVLEGEALVYDNLTFDRAVRMMQKLALSQQQVTEEIV